MTDELLYSKLAQHIADTGSPLPVLHGEHAGFLGVVYPILLAPFYGALDPVAAFDAGHVVNAVLFASTAIPVFLLARRLVPRDCALVVSFLSLAIPWAVNTATRCRRRPRTRYSCGRHSRCHGALAQPSPRRDAAGDRCARTRVLHPAAVPRARGACSLLAALVVDGPRQALARHRVLAGACVAAVVVVSRWRRSGRLTGCSATTASPRPRARCCRPARGRRRRSTSTSWRSGSVCPVPARRRVDVLEPARRRRRRCGPSRPCGTRAAAARARDRLVRPALRRRRT